MDLITSAQVIKLVASLLFVLGLMGGLHIALRYVNRDKLPKAQAEKRLSILESLPLDQRRRLILLQRDDTEHLIILGQTSETVIETNITKATTTKKKATTAKKTKKTTSKTTKTI